MVFTHKEKVDILESIGYKVSEEVVNLNDLGNHGIVTNMEVTVFVVKDANGLYVGTFNPRTKYGMIDAVFDDVVKKTIAEIIIENNTKYI